MRLAAQAAVGPAFRPHEGFVELDMSFYFPAPLSRMCKKSCNVFEMRDANTGQIIPSLPSKVCKRIHSGDYHGQDPDTSNLVKSTEDALKRLVFLDDNTVMLRQCKKQWVWAGAEGAQIKVVFL